MRVRMLEERSLCAYGEDEFITSMWLNLADATNEINSVRPAQVSRQFPRQEACM